MTLAPAAGRVILPWNTLSDERYVPSARQAEFHAAPERYKLYGGAVGGGKTTALAVEALLLSWDIENNEGVVGRRDFDDLRRTTYAEVLKWCPQELIRQHHRSEHWLELVNGSVIHFMELKDPGGLKNLNLGWFAIDQAEEVPYESFLWLQSRLRRIGVPRYFGLLSANPEPGWVKELFIEKRPPDHIFVPALPEDNPHLPADYVSSLLERWPDAYVRKLLRGSWDVVEDAVYPQLDRVRHLRDLPQRVEWVDGAIGVDYGTVHLSAVVAVQRSSWGEVWVRECWAQRGGDAGEIKRAVADMQRRYGIRRLMTDPTLGYVASDLGGQVARSGDGARASRIQMVTRLLNGPQPALRSAGGPPPAGLLFDAKGPGVRELFDEMAAYHYAKRETDYAADLVPVRKDDDRVAALEYAIEALETAPAPLPRTARVFEPRRLPGHQEWVNV